MFLTGVRHAPETDLVLATVLFTDIVGSTEKQAAMGDREWKRIVEQHHSIVREALTRYRGVENNGGRRLLRYVRRSGASDPVCSGGRLPVSVRSA